MVKDVEYINKVKSARIANISSIIIEMSYWAILSDEEKKHLDKIIKDLENYVDYLKEE